MRLLLCHNYYQQRGGEDESFEAEAQLLESHRHHVVRYTVHNDSIDGMRSWRLAGKTVWNCSTYRQISALIREHQPEVVHCTNTMPLISPAVYYAAHHHDVAVVQSLRNYRMHCPGALLFREGQPCESCVGRLVPWPGIVHACYRESRAATTVVAVHNALHGLLGTWRNRVDLYFAPTQFTRQKFIDGGLPADQIAVKPNFVIADPSPVDKPRDDFIFVGRLTVEKGVETMLEAWRMLSHDVRLRVIGDGPLLTRVKQAAASDKRIECLGQLPAEETLKAIGRARVLVMPSIWYETFGRTMIEAFSRGTPVLASRIGAMTEIVTHGETGLLFEPGDARDLAEQVTALLSDAERLQRMQAAARREYEQRFSPEGNYEILLQLYHQARANRDAKQRRSPAAGGMEDLTTCNELES